MADAPAATPAEGTPAVETAPAEGAFETPQVTNEEGAFETPAEPATKEGDGDVPPGNGEGEDEDAPGSEQEGKEDGPPETYETFTVPEGAVVDEARMTSFNESARAAGLTQEQAQDRLTWGLEQKAVEDKAIADYWAGEQEAWTQASAKLDLFKGDTLVNAAHGLRLLDTTGTLGPVLKSIGLDKHPATIQAFAAFGRAHSEDAVVGMTTNAGGADADVAAEDVMFDGPKAKTASD